MDKVKLKDGEEKEKGKENVEEEKVRDSKEGVIEK